MGATLQELAEDFARITASYAPDSDRARLISGLKTGGPEAVRLLPELESRLLRIASNARGVERDEARKTLAKFSSAKTRQ